MDVSSTYEVVRDAGVLVITPRATRDRLNPIGFEVACRQLEDELKRSSVHAIIIDCHQTNGFCYSALGLLLKLWKLTRDCDGHFVLCRLSAPEVEALRLVNLINQWPIYSSREEAIKAVRSSRPVGRTKRSRSLEAPPIA
jgi:anti-anti-sigma regulatory factor